ncbi:putative alpha/beta hydrolase [Mycolicibacter minnesotensis]
MTRPDLHYLQIADLIAAAGGDPWTIDDSLQEGNGPPEGTDEPPIAAEKAQVRAASRANIAELNATLEGRDAEVGRYLGLEGEGHDGETEIIECCLLAKADTIAALQNATAIHGTYCDAVAAADRPASHTGS